MIRTGALRLPGNCRCLMALILVLFSCLSQAQQADGWKIAEPGWQYEFPRDHGSHPGFKTEWWYFTGNLAAKNGRSYGFQLTFFRQGVIPPPLPVPGSAFGTRDVKLAHFAISDLSSSNFRHFQKFSRGAFGEAGFDEGNRVAWIGNWSCERIGMNAFHLKAEQDGVSLDLTLDSKKPPVIHGKDGVSQKSEGSGRASHYYSLSRLVARGTVGTAGAEVPVEGEAWFDHEWATNQLASNQKGWDWFSLQFDDGSELMLFQIRLDDGGRDAFSGGTFIRPDGSVVDIRNQDFTLKPLARWTSQNTHAQYPTRWEIAVAPPLDLKLTVSAAMDAQELTLQPIGYWEGAVKADGTSSGRPIRGKGYLEMTGYAGKIVGLQSTGDPGSKSTR